MLILLLLLFILVPIAELAVIIQVGQWIGVWWTIGLLLADSLLGSWLLRHQGRAAWRRFNEALRVGRVPTREVLDGTLVIFGGALLLTPGFITDVVGILLLVPPTRALFRALVRRLARRRFAFTVRTVGLGHPPSDPSGNGYAEDWPRRGYDVEGTAREVTDPSAELERGEDE